MAKVTGIPAIPPVPATATDPQLRAFLQALRDAATVRFSQTANSLDRSPTVRELIEGGIVVANGSGRAGTLGGITNPPSDSPFTDPRAPNAPITLAAAETPTEVILTWGFPDEFTRSIASFAEVAYSETNDILTAQLAGIGYESFVHAVGPNRTLYYWVRFISYSGVPSAYNAVSGTLATTPIDPTDFLALLNGAIRDSELTSALNTRIDLIDAPGTGLVDSVDELQTQVTSLAEATLGSVYVQTTAPVPGVGGVPDPIPNGARWYDSDDNNRAYIYDGPGLAWVDISDPRIGGIESDITSLEVRMGDAEGDIGVNATALDVLDASYTSLNGTVSTQATSITALEASASAVNLSGSLFTNPELTRRDLVNDRPWGIKAAYGTAGPAATTYADVEKTILRVYRPSDTTIGFVTPAFRVDPSKRYRALVRYRMVAGTTGGSGLYLRFFPKNSALAAGATHVAASVGEDGVDLSTDTLVDGTVISGTDTGTNAPGDTVGLACANRAVTALNTWYEAVVEYTPGETAQWASFGILTWSGLGISDFEVDRIYISEDTSAAASAVTALTVRVTDVEGDTEAQATSITQLQSVTTALAPSGVNLIPVGMDTFSVSLTTTALEAATTQSTAGMRSWETATTMFDGRALKFTGTGASLNYIFLAPSTTNYNIPVKENQKYLLSAWVYPQVASGSGRQIQLRFRRSDAAFATVAALSSWTINTWQRVSVVVGTPAGITAANVSIYLALISGAVIIDGVMLEEYHGEEAIGSAANTVTPSTFVRTTTAPVTSYAAFQTLATTTAGPDGLTAQYTVKVDVNGNVAGYGLSSVANNGTTISEMQFAVDRFSIRSPGSTSLVFGVSGGAVVMSGAYIQNATISDAKITTLNATKITAGSITAALGLTTGSINLTSAGKIYSGKSTFASSANGFFIGMDGGLAKFKFGNADDSRYISWDGALGRMNGGVLSNNDNIFLLERVVYNTTITPGTATAGFRLNPDGTAMVSDVTGVYASPGRWLGNGDSEYYQARMTPISGTLTLGTINTWQSLGSARTWSVQQNTAGSKVFIGILEVRRISDFEILASTEITLEGEVF